MHFNGWLHLNPAMKVTDIQRVLSINRTYISQLLRDAYGKTFYQIFTRETGLTPSQWRDSQGGEVNG